MMLASISTILPPIAALLFAQTASGGPPPVEQDRLRVCLDEARTDPATAIVNASAWVEEAYGAEASLPQQCLGFAYTSLLRWEAAEQAFLAARDARAEGDRAMRARLGAMAGNAALAGNRPGAAADLFDIAQQDAEAAGQDEIAGEIAGDRARALVATGREAEAGEVLAGARILAPQSASVWLLSATLSRRQGQLPAAQSQIETAAALAPEEPQIGLEGGLIATLAGDDEAARTSLKSVVALAPDSPQADTARTYLAQLEGAPQP